MIPIQKVLQASAFREDAVNKTTTRWLDSLAAVLTHLAVTEQDNVPWLDGPAVALTRRAKTKQDNHAVTRRLSRGMSVLCHY